MRVTPNGSGKGPIVVVDDDQLELQLARRCHQIANPSEPLLQFSSGFALLDYLSQVTAARQPMPSLVLLDLNMPGLSGFDVLERIRSLPQLSEMRCVIFTNSRRSTDRLRAKEFGADFVTKPDTADEFIRLLAAA